MKRTVAALLSVLLVGGCGVLVPYIYDAQTLRDRLVVSMSKEQVLKQLGKPNRVVQNEGQQTIWEYRFYPEGDWTAYVIHCPFFPNCYFPGEAGHPYYVVLQDNQLCLWGTPEVVRPLLGLVCGPTVPLDGQEHVRGDLRISVIPVFMPPPIVPLPQRLAIMPVDGSSDVEISSWLDLTLNFLRTRHRDLVLVEREDLQAVLEEMGIQYGGHVDDETSIHIGRLLGADSLLIYRMILPKGMPLSAAVELRLFQVESGTTLFRQMVSGSQTPPVPVAARTQRSAKPDSLINRLLLQETATYGLAALTAAFGDNPLGLVPDYTWSGQGIKVLDVLQGGPGFRAGIKSGDQIVESDDRPVGSWSDPVTLPAQLTVRHNGVPIEMSVR
ncbi:MAG: CsgG/HfaB family protein [Nitrospira sp.]|nr:CsgG/HfaB family protein [Nitrospira sp.]